MTDYKCGHNYEPIIVNNDIVTMSSYLVWKEMTSKTFCWHCWCKKE